MQMSYVLQFACNARTCDDRYAAAATDSSTMKKWKAQKTSPWAVPSGESSHSSPQSSLPGQWRRRRNSLVVVKSVHKNTEMQPMCVWQTQLTTATKATMMQTKSSSAAWSFNNLMVSSMTLRCSSHVQAQHLLPLRLHVTRLMIGSDMSGKCVLKKCTRLWKHNCGNTKINARIYPVNSANHA